MIRRKACTVLLFLGSLAAPSAAAPVTPPRAPDWTAAIKDREFQFDMARAGLAACIEAAKKAGAEVTIDGDPTRGEVELKVAKGGKPVALLAHSHAAFAVREGVLYFAGFSPYATGCKVTAYDLESGKNLWDQPLEGIGPMAHFKYSNRVILVVEKHPTSPGWGVVITGRESAGRYLEVLDPKTGKQVAHKKY